MDKPAVFLCGGCGLGDALDLEALRKRIARDKGAGGCSIVPCLCGELGRAAIAAAVAANSRGLVFGACSARELAGAFAVEGCHVERVALRELCAWSQPPRTEDTQLLAEDLLAMGLARAQKATVPVPIAVEVARSVLVVGGGPAGMAAALGAARAGYEVDLVEVRDGLGGYLADFSVLTPQAAPFRDLEPCDLPEWITAVRSEPRIRVHLPARIQRIAGEPGAFEVDLEVAGTPQRLRAGAIVQATGWRPYHSSRLEHLGAGRSPDVLTGLDLERMLGTGPLRRPSDGRFARRVAFVLCAGSRDPAHLPWCSGVCCAASLKQALRIRELDPEASCYVLYRDLRTPGVLEEFYRRAQEDPGLFFARGEVAGVEVAPTGLRLALQASTLGDEVALEADLVVLATGMVPVAADGEAIRRLRDARALIARGEQGPQREAAERTVTDLAGHEGSEILNLAYRQGPDLPVLEHGFPDSHFICFPYETRRTGIYVAGCARSPCGLDEARRDGEGAALKAIQCLELCARGLAVHPRWEDPTVPEFHLPRCTQCKRCTEECPYGALDEDAKGTPQPHPTRCRRCGTCLGACPERIVSFPDHSVTMVSAMIKAVGIPDEFEDKPRILAFLCENDALPALEAAARRRVRWSPYVRIVPVRCLGSVNVVWIADALARGFDGVLLVGCPSGTDTQCHNVRGSELMATRGENVRQKLQQLALEQERVRLAELTIADQERLPALIDAFAAEIQALGPNPFKDA